MNQTLLQLCQQCAARRAAKQSACPVDQAGIVQHATGGACPAGLYTPEAIKAMEDKVAASIAGARVLPLGRFSGVSGDDPPPAAVPAPIIPIPRDKWPFLLNRIAGFATPDDIGVGSTIERMLGAGGVAFKMLFEAFNVSCGCDKRRDSLDKKYPYRPDSEPTQSAKGDGG